MFHDVSLRRFAVRHGDEGAKLLASKRLLRLVALWLQRVAWHKKCMASAMVPVALPGTALVAGSVPHVVQMPCAPVRRASVPVPDTACALGYAGDLQEHFQLGALVP